nr:hypothetical protein BaRGS_011373 [Batillaria attramentaria]
MLGTLEPDMKTHWHRSVAPLVHAYNCTRHESTGYAPFYLTFGREPRLPIDLFFGLHRDKETQDHIAYVADLRQRLKKSYDTAIKVANEARRKQRANYDIRTRGAALQPGDRVLVRILAFEGKHKLSDKWEGDPYLVESQPNADIPVYVTGILPTLTVMTVIDLFLEMAGG